MSVSISPLLNLYSRRRLCTIDLNSYDLESIMIFNDMISNCELWVRPDLMQILVLGNDVYAFMYMYKHMRSTNAWLLKELTEYLFHPSRVAKFLETNDDIDEYIN